MGGLTKILSVIDFSGICSLNTPFLYFSSYFIGNRELAVVIQLPGFVFFQSFLVTGRLWFEG